MLSDEAYLASLRELCAIESVAGVEPNENAPYGKCCAEALDRVIALCDSFGFETKICENHRMGWAQIGAGSELVGILAHLDVVPGGSGWNYPAFALTEADGRLYGRGVSDDKGPAMACIYAMKDILDSGVPLSRRVRIIFGQSEETGDWADMEYYKAHEELPTFGFTPDGDFPAIYGEKRILRLNLRMPLAETGLSELAGGSAANVVPDHCRAVVASTGETVETVGKSAHASTPEEGENAIAKAMAELGEKLPGSPFVRFFNACIGFDLHGERIGCCLSDAESGCLTLNAGTVSVADGDAVLTLDIREPVTFEAERVLDPIAEHAASYGLRMELRENTAPIYMDKNGPVITKLLEVYRAETGDLSEPKVIGGGTYARSMEHIFAFGPFLPGVENTEHQKNEYLPKENVLLLRRIYRGAILSLAKA